MIDPFEQPNNIGLTHRTTRGCGKPLEYPAILSRIDSDYNDHVGYYLFHSDHRLARYSSELPTSFHDHLPLRFHTSISWTHNHLIRLRADQDPAGLRALHQILQSLAHSKNPDTSQSTAMLPLQPPNIWRRMHIERSSVRLERSRIRSTWQLDMTRSISRWTGVSCPDLLQQVSVESYVKKCFLLVTGNLNGWQWHMSGQSAKFNMVMSSAVGFSRRNVLMRIVVNGCNRLRSPWARLWKRTRQR